MINLDWTQVFSAICAIVIIVYAIREIRAYSGSAYWLVPIIIWQVLTIVFYAALNMDRLGIIDIPAIFTNLSTVLRMFGQITVAGVVVTWHLIHKIQRGSK